MHVFQNFSVTKSQKAVTLDWKVTLYVIVSKNLEQKHVFSCQRGVKVQLISTSTADNGSHKQR